MRITRTAREGFVPSAKIKIREAALEDEPSLARLIDIAPLKVFQTGLWRSIAVLEQTANV